MNNKSLLQYLTAFAILSALIFSHSCANTSAAPQGGPKDTLPPLLVEMSPTYFAVNHPTDKKKSEVWFKFNEYVVLNSPGTNIFLSPPQAKPPQAKIKGKKVVITFQEPLDSNQSYSLSLGDAIKDNNEGNMFPPFVHSFSTGPVIDSLFVSGTVQDAVTMLPLAGITVLFHTDPSDSAIYKVRPRAAAKTDSWGYFAVRNLPADTLFRVFAIEDLNNNNLYDPDMERVAFVDTLVVPSAVMHFDSPELVAMDKKDTVGCLSRPSQLQVSLFRELTTKNVLRNRGRASRRMMYVTFSSPNPIVDSIRVKGIPQEKLLFEYNFNRDSINIWINEQGAVADTLMLYVDYMKTDDSLKILVPQADTFRMAIPKPKMKKDKKGEMKEVIDTVAKYKLELAAETVDQDGIRLLFDTPLISAPFDSITIKSVNARQQESYAEFTVEEDSLNFKNFTIRMKEKLNVGNEYTIKIPGRQFRDINGYYCDSLVKKFSLPTDESLSSITLEVNGVNLEKGRYIIELVDEKRTKIYRKYSIDTTSVLSFPYLKAGKYSLRLTRDINGNGVIDTGSILEKRQPEKVLMYRFNESLGNNAFILDLPERMDITQSIDIGELFK